MFLSAIISNIIFIIAICMYGNMFEHVSLGHNIFIGAVLVVVAIFDVLLTKSTFSLYKGKGLTKIVPWGTSK